ncbi:MAG: hypothetical protein ACTSO4_14335, partial [Promethearchaeota archaeon]
NLLSEALFYATEEINNFLGALELNFNLLSEALFYATTRNNSIISSIISISIFFLKLYSMRLLYIYNIR